MIEQQTVLVATKFDANGEKETEVCFNKQSGLLEFRREGYFAANFKLDSWLELLCIKDCIEEIIKELVNKDEQ